MIQLLKLLLIGKDEFAIKWFKLFLEAIEKLSTPGKRKLFKTILALLMVFVLAIIYMIIAHADPELVDDIEKFLLAICALAGIYGLANVLGDHNGKDEKNGKK